MALINWCDDYSVGNDEIDSQHKKMIEIINNLCNGIKAKKGNEIMGPVLDQLSDYTVFHFSTEEKLFEKYNFPNKMNHNLEHSNLIRNVTDFKENHLKGKALLTFEVMNYLKGWLINHICKSDKEYAEYFRYKGIF